MAALPQQGPVAVKGLAWESPKTGAGLDAYKLHHRCGQWLTSFSRDSAAITIPLGP